MRFTKIMRKESLRTANLSKACDRELKRRREVYQGQEKGFHLGEDGLKKVDGQKYKKGKSSSQKAGPPQKSRGGEGKKKKHQLYEHQHRTSAGTKGEKEGVAERLREEEGEPPKKGGMTLE